MNKKKINTLIAYAVLSCVLVSNIPSFVYAEEDINSESSTVIASLEKIENFEQNTLTRTTAETPVTFTDSNFEAMVRSALKIDDSTPIYPSTLEQYGAINFSIDNNNITSIVDIVKIPNLDRVSISGASASLDLSPLKQLAKLETVNLSYGTYDLDQLPVAKIKSLDLYESTFDASKLANFTVIENLGYSMIKNASEFSFASYLANSQTLKSLNLSIAGNFSSNDISEIQSLTMLEDINIGSYKDEYPLDLNVLKPLTNLKNVRVYNANPETLSALNNLTALESLSLTNSSINNFHLLECMDTLNRVTDINLSKNKLTSTEGINTLAKDKKINISNNFIDLSVAEDKQYLDSIPEYNAYPQKRLTTKEDGKNFILGINEFFDLDALKIENIFKDGSTTDSSVFSTDIEYRIASTDTDFLKIDNNNRLSGTKVGNATVHINIEGIFGPTSTVTVTISATDKPENTGVVTVKTVTEDGVQVGDNEIAYTFEKGKQMVYAPHIQGFYHSENESLYKMVDVAAGSINNVKFTYKPIDSSTTNYGKVEVVYMDTKGNLLEQTPEIRNYQELKEYTILPKEFDGYTVLEDCNKFNIELTSKNPYHTVVFVYQKDKEVDEVVKGSITINYVDDATNKTIRTSEVRENLGVGAYEIEAAAIDGYTLIGDAKKTINVTEATPNANITFRYSKNQSATPDNDSTAPVTKGSITVNYVDNQTGEPISESEVKRDLALGNHNVNAKAITGYTVIGDSTLNVSLTSSAPNVNITFRYSKNQNVTPDNDTTVPVTKGSITIKYVDSDTGVEISNNTVLRDLELGKSKHSGKEISGFTCVTEDIVVELTKEKPDRTIVFKYTSFVDNENVASFTLTPAMLSYYVNNGYNWSASTEIVSVTLNNVLLSDIQNNISSNISVGFNKTHFKNSILTELKNKYNKSILETFAITTNLPKVNTNQKAEISLALGSDVIDDELYLYVVNGNGSVSLVDRAIAKGAKTNGSIVSFDVDINQVNNADFIVTKARIADEINSNDTTNNENKPNDGNQSDTENNKDEETGKLPDTSGLSGVISTLSIISIVGGLLSFRKKK